MEGPGHGLDVALGDGPQEVGLRLDRGRAGGAFGQVQEGADGADGVGQRHQGAAVENTAGRAAAGVPCQPGPHLTGLARHEVGAEHGGEGHGGAEALVGEFRLVATGCHTDSLYLCGETGKDRPAVTVES